MKNIFTIWIPILVFHLIFWNAEQGLNVLLFSTMLTGGIIVSKTYVIQRKEIIALLAIWNAIAILFVWHDTLLSLIVFWILFFILIGVLQEIRVRFWFFGLVESIRALFAGWAISARASLRATSEGTPLWPLIKQLRLLLIPLLLLIPFYFIYVEASTEFATIHNKISLWFNQFLNFDFDWKRIWHFILGIVLVLAMLGRRYGLEPLHKFSDKWEFELKRNKKSTSWQYKSLALKREYQMAIISFISLNVLLALVNIIDINNVWFSTQERTAAELSQYVHQGTFLLIFSIFLAMLVVLLFFRANLNFYFNNKRLLQLTYLWLAQNAFLAISVAIRNGHYIHHNGLAHGRIQVVFFLLLVILGLYSMYQKIKGPKTIFYLIQSNGWALIVCLLLACSMNWDAMITRYNLANHHNDMPYHTYSLTNNLIPLLADQNGEFSAEPAIELKDIIHKGDSHVRRWEKSDWRSWTWSGHRQYQAWIAFNKKYDK